MAFNPAIAGAITAATTHSQRVNRINNTNANIINKTIVYSDTVLPLKDLGDNLKVTSISNVKESSLEGCLKIIFESNTDVIFNTIQYSREDEIVYFYTNKEITTKAYEESKFTKYKPITSKAEILQEVKRVLISYKVKDKDCISLYDVAQVLRKLRREYENMKDRYQEDFNDIIKSKIYHDSSVVVHDFDYKENVMIISFGETYDSDYKDIYFSKKDGDLYIVKSESIYDDDVFEALCSQLSKLYDEFLKYADYKDNKNAKYDEKSVNSNFGISTSEYGAEIFVKDPENKFIKAFELSAHSYEDEYDIDCNSSSVIEVVKGNEEEIFKRIFVKIEDCPKWCRQTLYKIRQEELDEQQRKEEEKRLIELKKQEKLKQIEMKKQKRLALKRKIFPFLKEEGI